MLKKTVFIICLLLISSSIVIADDIPELFWTDPELVPPMTGEEIKDKYWTDKPFEKYELYRTENPDYPMPNGKLLVVVNNTLYSSVQTSINNYKSKMESLGYTVILWTCQYGDPVDMRTELQDFYDVEDYFTLFIIGDFPPALSEIGYFSGENTPYPIDLFLMDLDGVWTDSDHDGYYDQHTGETTPEIALGRLWASNLNYESHTEAQLINDYFTKNLDYYNGGMSEINRRGLAFVDDDWEYYANMWGGDVGLAYDDMTIISDRDTTCDTVYEDYLTNNYESILLCCHSNPNLHHFKINSGWDGYTYYYDIYNIEPTAIFFNLFCCSNAQYTYNDCMVS
jgi:hypothetical protein